MQNGVEEEQYRRRTFQRANGWWKFAGVLLESASEPFRDDRDVEEALIL